MKINKSNWQEFKFDEVFTISRGKRLVKLNQIPGDIAYISSSKKNNGVDNYILSPDYMKIYKNALTLSNSGSVGYCFYHPYKFVASDHCTVINVRNRKVKLNNYIALFLKPIIESMKNKYNFAREINNDRLKKEKILLPTSQKDNPDWAFMEIYIKSLSEKIKYDSKIIKNTPLLLNKNKFYEFELTKLFNVRGAKRSYTQNEISHGEYLYVTTSNKNNGVASTSSIYTEKGNVITIDSATDGKAFYQEHKFVGSDHVEVLESIDFDLNKYIAMFIISVLNLQLSKYGFGRKRSQKRIQIEKIFLPAIDDDTPDFEFMENYIKSFSYSSAL